MGRFQANYRGVGDMLISAGMQREMLRRAQKVRAQAAATAPVSEDASDTHRGRYKESFTASAGVQSKRTRRAVGTVTSNDPAAYQIEFGTGAPDGARTPRHRTLGKALDAARD